MIGDLLCYLLRKPNIPQLLCTKSSDRVLHDFFIFCNKYYKPSDDLGGGVG